MSRDLPILDSDGKFRARAGLWTWCYMSFSEVEEDAIRAGDCMFDENESINAGRQETYGEVGRAIGNLMGKRLLKARIAGQVFWQMILNCENRGEADFRKAVFSVSEWASCTKTETGKPLPSNGDNLRGNFKVFKSAMYFWASFDLMSENDQNKIFAATNDESAYLKFLATAASLQERAEKLDIANKTDALKDWNPWVVPDPVRERLLEMVTVSFPEEPELIKERLSSYRNKPFETYR